MHRGRSVRHFRSDEHAIGAEAGGFALKPSSKFCRPAQQHHPNRRDWSPGRRWLCHGARPIWSGRECHWVGWGCQLELTPAASLAKHWRPMLKQNVSSLVSLSRRRLGNARGDSLMRAYRKEESGRRAGCRRGWGASGSENPLGKRTDGKPPLFRPWNATQVGGTGLCALN